jgi:hypothetical protein
MMRKQIQAHEKEGENNVLSDLNTEYCCCVAMTKMQKIEDRSAQEEPKWQRSEETRLYEAK